MTYIFQNNFNDPFPSLYPHYQSCNGNFDTDKPNPHSTNFPLYEKEITNILSYRTMKVRMAKTIGSIKKMMRELLAAVSLLFGMCSSQPCFILDAFCGGLLSPPSRHSIFCSVLCENKRIILMSKLYSEDANIKLIITI